MSMVPLLVLVLDDEVCSTARSEMSMVPTLSKWSLEALVLGSRVSKDSFRSFPETVPAPVPARAVFVRDIVTRTSRLADGRFSALAHGGTQRGRCSTAGCPS